MNVIGICAKLHPEVKTLTFEWMSNHYHGLHVGPRSDVMAFTEHLFSMLESVFRRTGRVTSLSQIKPQERSVDALQDLRNVIAYINRNGYLVSRHETPFSYPWGANRYYFNPDAKQLYRSLSKPVGTRERREMSGTRQTDGIKDLFALDGCVCPLCFCDIQAGERMYRDANHYYYSVSRKIESHKSVAAEIGESVFYTDEELFGAISALSAKNYGQPQPRLAPREAKIELARAMRFDYNATARQIQRILRLEDRVLQALFPAGGR